MRFRIVSLLFVAILAFGCKSETAKTKEVKKELVAGKDSLIYPEEVHFKSIRQVTFGGDNAEAYWSFDDKQLVFQSNNKGWGVECDQMFLMNVDETFENKVPPMISTGKGRTTCAYFLPDNKSWVYGSTH